MRATQGTEKRRSPCGERGLKSLRRAVVRPGGPSLPVRGAWIEITRLLSMRWKMLGRSPCGERGLKFTHFAFPPFRALRRSPCGERGLKCQKLVVSAPRRAGRSPCGERGLKCRIAELEADTQKWSLPVRGAWIEIPCAWTTLFLVCVAPRAGSVD